VPPPPTPRVPQPKPKAADLANALGRQGNLTWTFGNEAYSAHATSVDIRSEYERVDVTSYGSGYQEAIPGLHRLTLTFQVTGDFRRITLGKVEIIPAEVKWVHAYTIHPWRHWIRQWCKFLLLAGSIGAMCWWLWFS
jgi:hypothetical protein